MLPLRMDCFAGIPAPTVVVGGCEQPANAIAAPHIAAAPHRLTVFIVFPLPLSAHRVSPVPERRNGKSPGVFTG